MSAGVTPASVERHAASRGVAPAPTGSGWAMWCPSEVMPGAGDLRVDAGAARRGVLRGLQHQDAGALAEDEAVAALVVRAGRPLGLVVASRQRHHRGERGHRQRVEAGLGAAGDDDVGAAGADHLEGVRDGLGARGAGATPGCARRPGRQNSSPT